MSLVLALALLAGEASAQTTTERVSVSSNGDQGNENSFFPSISADGRFVAFQSYAFNLQLGDDNETSDIFVHDREKELGATGVTTLVSMHSNGIEGNNGSSTPSISADDGRFVAFQSFASNLVDGDTNNLPDIFVHDRDADEDGTFDEGGIFGEPGSVATTLVSVDSAGGSLGSGGAGLSPSISPDGRFVAFQYTGGGIGDIFVRDRDADENGVFDEPGSVATTRVSVDSAGSPGNSDSSLPSISADGRFVAFQSWATDLVAEDTNPLPDIFVHDRDADGNGTFDETGGIATTLVSVNSAGDQVFGNNFGPPSISADDGRFVAFYSDNPNLGTSGLAGVFVHDRDADEDGMFDEAGGIATTWVAEGSSPSISADGRFVAFQSGDIFVRDRETGETTLVSVDSAGSPGNSESHSPSISANGRFVAFSSLADNLVPVDTNKVEDIFVHGPLAPPCDLNNDGLFNSKDSRTFFMKCSNSSATWPCDLDGNGTFGLPDLFVFLESCEP